MLNGNKIDLIGALPYSLPTNGTYVTGDLLYVDSSADISKLDLKGKVIMRDYPLLAIPEALIAGPTAYYVSSDTTVNGTYTRPFVVSPDADMLACSVGGATGYISAFNVSRDQLESYYDGHAGIHWLIPGVYVGAAEFATLRKAAADGAKFSIRIDAKAAPTRVPRLHATLPGISAEEIWLVTHTDGATFVQENGPVALLTLARYFASLPITARPMTLRFAFEASHLAFQRDSDKLLAVTLNKTYDNPDGNTAFVIAIEHLGSSELEPVDYPNATASQYLRFTGRDEPLLWSVGPSQPAIDAVVNVSRNASLTSMIVAPGFPPVNTSQVPEYASFGGIGGYYHDQLVPTMALISGPWSLWAPSFGASAINFKRLREHHIAIGNTALALAHYNKSELAGNYTQYRIAHAEGIPAASIQLNASQIVTGPDMVY